MLTASAVTTIQNLFSTMKIPAGFRGLTFVLLAGLVSSCATTSEVRQLEAQVALLAQELDAIKATPKYELRLDSATVAIEKNRERLDNIVPADAQWLPLEPGGSLRWYLDSTLGNAYLQYVRQKGSLITFKLSSQTRNTEHSLHPGESISHRLGKDGVSHHLVVTLHRIHYPEGSFAMGLFSISQSAETHP